MEYFVVADDGQKYGPANLATLNEWANQKRIQPNTILEDATTGQRLSGNQVLGLTFPMQSAQPPMGGGYQQPPMATQYPRGDFNMDDGADDMKKAWIFGSIGLLCCPIIFSSMGIHYSSVAKRKGHPNAQNALIYCICTLVIGIGIGIIFRVASSNIR